LYENTDSVSELKRSGTITRVHKGVYDEYQQQATLGPLSVTLHYRLYPVAPFFELAATLSSKKATIVRNFHIDIRTQELRSATLNAPGNLLRRDVPMGEFGSQPLGISPLGGLRGSSGIVAATDADSTLVLWPNQPTEIPDIFISVDGSRLALKTQINFAAEVSGQSAAEVLLMTMNLERGGFELVREHWPAWASRYG